VGAEEWNAELLTHKTVDGGLARLGSLCVKLVLPHIQLVQELERASVTVPVDVAPICKRFADLSNEKTGIIAVSGNISKALCLCLSASSEGIKAREFEFSEACSFCFLSGLLRPNPRVLTSVYSTGEKD
jgi:hypothetical protein